jgi:hypothetical protein
LTAQNKPDEDASNTPSKKRRSETHPSILRGFGCGIFGLLGSLLLIAFVAPRASDAVLISFCTGGFVVGAAIGIVLGIQQKKREDRIV